MLAINRDVGPILRIDDEGAILARLFLGGCVAVVPIGAGLTQGELVLVRFARLHAVKAVEAGRAIMVPGDQQAMPVNCGHFRQLVFQVDGNGIAFPKAQDRAR